MKNPKQPVTSAPRITEAEWKVMLVFWDSGEASLREAIDRLSGGPDWKPRTVQTLIRRLVKKGALRVKENTRDFRYFPAVSQSDCQLDESRSFLDRVFEGRLVPFMARMVENEKISPGEIDQIRQLLDEAAKTREKKNR